jgi:signal transduction histidine kinase
MPTPGEDGFAEAVAGTRAVELAGEASPYAIRRVLAPVRDASGELLALAYIELRLPLPWRSFMLKLSFEWPIIWLFMIVFGLASSFFFAAWVTRRLERIARAASAWSRGDFSNRIGDRSRDELGIVSGLLDRMALELRTLMRSRAQPATLAERQRLARDLHDTVKQKAFALNMQLATARRVIGEVPGSDRLEQAQRLTQQIQRELGELLDEMRASDADLPLVERVRSRANDWSHTSGMSVALRLDDVPPLSAPTEDALLRIVDEALSNVLRHSGASHVDIELRRETERVELAIADNGRGAADDAPAGMGLRNMRERVQALPAGRFSFESRRDGGTRVAISFLVENPGR